jgi:putative addiction module killer protein
MFTIQKTEYFNDWLRGLRDIRGKAKILARLKRAEQGNLGDHKPVGDGVLEMRVNFGPGYRVYFSRRGGIVIIILVGGDKSSQERDIRKAKQIASEIGV